MAKVQKFVSQGKRFSLNDLKGISELQTYFAGTSDSLCATIDRSLQALQTIEDIIQWSKPYEVLMTLDWTDNRVYFQRKDLHVLQSAFHALKFVMHFVSAHHLHT